MSKMSYICMGKFGGVDSSIVDSLIVGDFLSEPSCILCAFVFNSSLNDGQKHSLSKANVSVLLTL